MDFAALNRIAMNTYLPNKALSELEKGQTYMVTQLKQISTKFGLKVVIVVDEEYQVFLPDRVSKVLDNNDKLFADLAMKANKYALYIKYHGDNKFEFM